MIISLTFFFFFSPSLLFVLISLLLRYFFQLITASYLGVLFWSCFNFHQALLHFIYTDSIAEDVVVSSSSSSSESCVGDNFMAKLLAAADKYGLERLRLMCESHLCKNLSVRSVAQVLSFAEEHHATELKAVCLRFAAMNLGGTLFFDFVVSVILIKW